jgi:hypothetical protein
MTGDGTRTAAAAMLLLCAVLAAAAGRVPPMDDTYIHLVYGRSIVRGAPLEYNPGEPSSGFTSPLWLIPAAAASLAGAAAPPLLMAFSCAAAAAAVLLCGSATAGMLLLLLGPLLFHAGSGMETASAVLAVVLVWRRADGAAPPDWKAGILLAGAAMVRPELALMAVPLALSAGRPRPGGLVRLLAPALAAGTAWIAWNLHATGMPLPSTFYAKQAGAAAYGLLPGLTGLARGLVVGAPLLAPAGAAATWLLLRRRPALGLVCLAALLPAVVLQPNSFFQMRYHVPWLAAFALACARVLGRRRWAAALLALSLVPGALVFASRRIRASADVRAIDVRPAMLVSRTAAEGDVVAAADVGAMGWLSGARVLDLDGLVTPTPPRGDHGGPRWSWVRDRADYLAAFPWQYAGLIAEAGEGLRLMRMFRSPSPVICGEDAVGLWEIVGSR